MMSRLEHDDIVWIAERIHEHRSALRTHSQWECRIMDLLAVLVWSASVDGRQGGLVKKDGWINAGNALKAVHFERAPHTPSARAAFDNNDLSSIKREHVVPRNTLRSILLKTASVEDSVRVIREHSIVALVHDTETPRLKPSSSMPKGWAADINWSKSPLPDKLPSPWERYSKASPPVVPVNANGTPVY